VVSGGVVVWCWRRRGRWMEVKTDGIQLEARGTTFRLSDERARGQGSKAQHGGRRRDGSGSCSSAKD
jgi:hypothetical protein